MEFLLNFPAFAKVGISFLGIILLTRIKIPLAYSILIFSILLTLWTGIGFKGFIFQINNLISPDSWLLFLAIFFLLFFTESLNKTGRMKKTIDALSLWFKTPLMLLMGLPALVGLLPMPGGALFSAPFVDATDSKKLLSPLHKASINYWFRHGWEYWWPLYPGVILAIKYSQLPAGIYFLIQLPFTFAAILGGYYFLFYRKGLKDSLSLSRENIKKNLKSVLSTLIPILIIVLSSIICSIFLPIFSISKSLASLIGILIGLFLGLCIIFQKNPSDIKACSKMFLEKNTWEMMLLIVGVIMFSSALKCPLNHGESQTLVTAMRDEFINMGIPILLIIAIIPFVSGFVTGIAFGYVGSSFPIIFALLGPNPSFNVLCAITTLAYGCGYFGMILSPVHICLVVTNQYFKTRLLDSYKYIFMPAFVIFIASIFMSLFYYFLF